MKVAILAGGLGTRLREETEFKPKPMVEVGGKPILWHIMKTYSFYGYNDFVICLGFKGDIIRDYFLNYEMFSSDITINLGSRKVIKYTIHDEADWNVTLAETGDRTLTGGRIKRIGQYLDGGAFMTTYGDGLADVNLHKLLAFHKNERKLATVTAVHPPSRFGELAVHSGGPVMFKEKPQVHSGWINGGFFVFEPEVLGLIGGDQDTLEQGLLEKLAEMQQLSVYEHNGFWQCMDTYREMTVLNELWDQKKAPWKVWE